ncbi:multidrug resistance-associated ABC transporter [Roridomyces roridus]|uniref:Multidrug resistance-associated ABC transporter n=1 Tax=Roridomyces roridus TaxID=1738132 RepID=A0AAD7FTG4_9AGAR|nr:multidrug resistance-associated ABC transporter [Roridomyces roridus]
MMLSTNCTFLSPCPWSLSAALVFLCSTGPPLVDHNTYDTDPFDVTKPEDLVHGYPIIEENAFWSQMKYRKVFLCALLCCLATIQVSAVVRGDGIESLIPELCYSLYLLCVGIASVGQVERHGEFVWQLTVLAVFRAALYLFAAILPDDSNAPNGSSPFPWLSRLVLILYVVLAFVAINTPLGPPLRLSPSAIYSEETACGIENKENVTGVVGSSPWSRLYFSYVWKVVKLGNVTQSVEIADLPIIPVELRAVTNYDTLKRTLRDTKLTFWSWKPRPGSGATLAYQLLCANFFPLAAEAALTVCVALLTYAPPACLNQLVRYLESDPTREDTSRGWFWVIVLFTANTALSLARGQLWSLCSTNIKMQIRNQLNGVLFAKTLVKKDRREFSSKAQIMTLMTADVGRVGNLTWYVFDVLDAPIEIFVAAYFLYQLLGVSSLVGLAATCFFTPLNHFASRVVVGTQSKLMKARDERIGLMNEVLGGIRMIKFMAWERNFEARVMSIREKELKYQKLTYTISVLWNALWTGSPILITVLSFWHFAVVRQQTLTPSIAFTAVILFNQLRFALSALPNSVIQILQVALSLGRIEKYLGLAQVAPVPPIEQQSPDISFRSCTVTWAQDIQSAESHPNKFVLTDLTLDFPRGELSLVCGALGSGKSLMLLALLGEADVVAGQMTCPRSPADALACFSGQSINAEDWLVEGMCAYVPQVAWLSNASVKDNILFHLPYQKERYEKTLEACALIQDLHILEDGDQSLVGERGLTLSGGQRARVSLARAIYSRASILLLDDVLSAVDAHTAHHLYHSCLKGELVKGRTVILVSHHVQLCASGANYIVALNNGHVQFAGTRGEFQASQVLKTLVQSTVTGVQNDKEQEVSKIPDQNTLKMEDKKQVKKIIEQEFRAVGRVSRKVWTTYVKACGGGGYWLAYSLIFIIAALSSVVENGWLSYWSGGKGSEDPTYYVTIYSILTIAGLVVTTNSGSIRASNVLYRRLLRSVLFADFRFHDTSSRGRLLNRFGKDFEGIDSGLSENFGYCTVFALATITSMMLLNFTGGLPFLLATIFIAIVFYSVTSIFVQTARDVQRLESVTQSPLYSMYSENIAGVAVIRAFGASSKILRDMLRAIDTNATAHYWTWGLTRWLSGAQLRFELLAGLVMCTIAAVMISNKNLSAATAGLALSFSGTVASNLLYLVRRWVQVEQSMVALERVNEYCEIDQEPPEFMEPRPPPSWPSAGAIQCQDLVVRYAPELPAVLHGLTFNINAGEKIGILGRTGSGKSTLALSFLRFVSPSQGKITIDGIDISQVGLTDLRNKLSIIPQDPTILSGTLRSTLDVLGEYSDAEIFEALRRVHLIQSREVEGAVNVNLFSNLDSLISEGGDSLSAGEKQLLCMARAILKKSRILLMDEATASVDYATDELISRTIMEEFTSSTLLTVAHRIRSVINHDKIMVLDQGRIAEFDSPAALLRDPSSQFYALCKATGSEEFGTLRILAGL